MTGPLEAGAIDDACCPSVDRTCGHINFFTSAETADEWASDHPDVTGFLLAQAEAVTCGVAEFGSLLEPGGSVSTG